MPKRKRTHRVSEEINPAQDTEFKKQKLERKLVHGKKVLNRALKTAKGLEWQKLSKRIKLVTTQNDGREAGRLQKELDVLKARVQLPLSQHVLLIGAAFRPWTYQSLSNPTSTKPS